MHVKKWGRMYRVLLHEIANEIQGGLAADLRNLSAKYNIRDITVMEVSPDQITEACRKVSYLKQWNVHLKMKTLPTIPEAKKYKPWHHEMPYNMARVYSMLNLGLLVLKSNQPHKFRERDMNGPKDRSCLWPMCDGRDEWSHLVTNSCPFYSSKYIPTGDEIKDVCLFIQKLNWERTKVFKTPLVIFGGSDDDDMVSNSVMEAADLEINNKEGDQLIIDQVLKSDRGRNLIPDSNKIKTSKVVDKVVPRLDILCSTAARKKVVSSFEQGVKIVLPTQSGDFSAHTPLGHCLSVTRIMGGRQKSGYNANGQNQRPSLISAFGESKAKIRSMNQYNFIKNDSTRKSVGVKETTLQTTDTFIDFSGGAVSHVSVITDSHMLSSRVDRVARHLAHRDPGGTSTTIKLEVVRELQIKDEISVIVHHGNAPVQMHIEPSGPQPGPSGTSGNSEKKRKSSKKKSLPGNKRPGDESSPSGNQAKFGRVAGSTIRLESDDKIREKIENANNEENLPRFVSSGIPSTTIPEEVNKET